MFIFRVYVALPRRVTCSFKSIDLVSNTLIFFKDQNKDVSFICMNNLVGGFIRSHSRFIAGMAMEGTSTKHTVSDTTSKSDLSQTKFVIVWIITHALINVV